jgi:Fur family ferric uptake transcriptional regulator
MMNPLAETLIRRQGRVTPARARVLAALLDAPRALTHCELERQLGEADTLDRVTLYRVLEWLVEQGLAHKIAGEDRVWRFNSSAGETPKEAHRHAHFRCLRCGQVYCLEGANTEFPLDLPTGFLAEGVELTVTGRCPECR